MSEQPVGSVVLDVFEPNEAEVIAALLRGDELWVALSTNAPSAAGPRFIAGGTEGLGRMVEVYVRPEDLDEARSIVDGAATATLPPEFAGPEIDEWVDERARSDDQAKRLRRIGVIVLLLAIAALIAISALS